MRGKVLNLIKNKKGQATVEFMLLMGTTIALVISFFTLFHEKFAGWFFYIVGATLGG